MVHTQSYHVISKPIICSKYIFSYLWLVNWNFEHKLSGHILVLYFLNFLSDIIPSINRILWTSPDDFGQGIWRYLILYYTMSQQPAGTILRECTQRLQLKVLQNLEKCNFKRISRIFSNGAALNEECPIFASLFHDLFSHLFVSSFFLRLFSCLFFCVYYSHLPISRDAPEAWGRLKKSINICEKCETGHPK